MINQENITQCSSTFLFCFKSSMKSMLENSSQQNLMSSRISLITLSSWLSLFWLLPFKCFVSNLEDNLWKLSPLLNNNTSFVLDSAHFPSLLDSSLSFSSHQASSISLPVTINQTKQKLKPNDSTFMYDRF